MLFVDKKVVIFLILTLQTYDSQSDHLFVIWTLQQKMYCFSEATAKSLDIKAEENNRDETSTVIPVSDACSLHQSEHSYSVTREGRHFPKLRTPTRKIKSTYKTFNCSKVVSLVFLTIAIFKENLLTILYYPGSAVGGRGGEEDERRAVKPAQPNIQSFR